MYMAQVLLSSGYVMLDGDCKLICSVCVPVDTCRVLSRLGTDADS